MYVAAASAHCSARVSVKAQPPPHTGTISTCSCRHGGAFAHGIGLAPQCGSFVVTTVHVVMCCFCSLSFSCAVLCRGRYVQLARLCGSSRNLPAVCGNLHRSSGRHLPQVTQAAGGAAAVLRCCCSAAAAAVLLQWEQLFAFFCLWHVHWPSGKHSSQVTHHDDAALQWRQDCTAVRNRERVSSR